MKKLQCDAVAFPFHDEVVFFSGEWNEAGCRIRDATPGQECKHNLYKSLDWVRVSFWIPLYDKPSRYHMFVCFFITNDHSHKSV